MRLNLALATIAVALAGCGGDDDGTTTNPTNGETANEESSSSTNAESSTSLETTAATSSSESETTADASSSSDSSSESSGDSSSESTGSQACGAEHELEAWPTSGFLITFTAVGEQAHLWVDNPDTIDYVDAWLVKPDVPIGIPGGPTELDATFNPGYSYRLVPTEVTFGEVWTEVCDAAPCYIEDDAMAWFENPNQWCPWSFELVAIHDCREGDGTSCTPAYP